MCRIAAFRDRYLDLPFDLSGALFVATATNLGSAPAMLRERMQIVELPGYVETEKREIATRYLLPGLLGQHGLTTDQVEVTDEAIGAIIGGYTREAGVWRLAAVLGEVCAKVVRRRSEGDEAAVEVTPEKLSGMLGAPRHPALAEVAGRTGRPGVAVGLCCTAGGTGEASVIEASRMAGSGALTLTGGLGEAMQESPRAVLSWLRANAERYDIDPGGERAGAYRRDRLGRRCGLGTAVGCGRRCALAGPRGRVGLGLGSPILVLCEHHGSRHPVVKLFAVGLGTGVAGLPASDDWTPWGAGRMRAAVEYLEHLRVG